MGPLTQPMTEAERAAAREWMSKGPSSQSDNWTSSYETGPMVRYTEEPVIEPVTIDWLRINEEFS